VAALLQSNSLVSVHPCLQHHERTATRHLNYMVLAPHSLARWKAFPDGEPDYDLIAMRLVGWCLWHILTVPIKEARKHTFSLNLPFKL